MNKKAFSLFEVLIALSIIGILASLTLPSLTDNTSGTEIKIKTRSMYSALSILVDKMAADNNNDALSGITTDTELRDRIKPYTHFTTEYATVSAWDSTYTPKRLDESASLSISTQPMIILDNGTVIIFKYNAGNGYIDIDINGAKGPNLLGIDFHVFSIINNDLMPHNNFDTGDCVTTAVKGYSCTERILKNQSVIWE